MLDKSYIMLFMNENYYINKKFTIDYMQKYMKTTTFKYLELLEIEMQEATSRLYNQDEIDLMNQKEYDALNKADDFFEDNAVDFRVSSNINLKNMIPDEDIFKAKLNFIMYGINECCPKEKSDWFYLNIYLSDLCPSKKKSLTKYYKEYGKIKNPIGIINAITDHYIECEAYRTMIYLLQENILLDIPNTKKLLKYIIKMISSTDDNFTIYLNILKDLILNKELFYASKKSYAIFEKISISDISHNILYNFSFDVTSSLTHEAYEYLKIPLDIYNDVVYEDIRDNILNHLYLLELDCILCDYCERKEKQFSKLKKGLEVGLELIALSLHLKKIHNQKKGRVKKTILEKYENSENFDLAILQTIYYFNEHNAHHLQFLVVPLSHYLALNYEESFQLLQGFGFYHHESPNQKQGNFRKHFTLLQEAYNSNFKYLNN